ncbi:hypothetical protein [Facklamia sp. P9177]
MMSVNADSKIFEARNQIAFHALEELVLEDHLLRKILALCQIGLMSR